MKRAGEGIGKPFDPSTKLRMVSLPNHKLRVPSMVEGDEGGRNALIFHLPYSIFLIPVIHCSMENRYET